LLQEQNPVTAVIDSTQLEATSAGALTPHTLLPLLLLLLLRLPPGWLPPLQWL
jgi:hypothetical protein